MTYLLDANVFIQAKNLHYGFDFCPAFWDWVDREFASGVVASVDSVLGELKAGADELATWASARPTMFRAPGQADLLSLRVVSAWTDASSYEPGAKSTFLAGADYYLVAQALAANLTVVTHERVADTRKQIKIPNACLALGVSCITPFQMLQQEGARFVL